MTRWNFYLLNCHTRRALQVCIFSFLIAFKIRAARRADAARIEQPNIFLDERMVGIERGECFVAEVDGRVDDFITISSHWFFVQPMVVFLCVAPEARRRGLGEALLEWIENRVEQPRLFISTEENNAPMHALLKKRAWTRAGSIDGLNLDGVPEIFYFKDLQNLE